MIVVLLIAMIPLALFNGWVLSVMWNWFIPTTFNAIPPLSIGQAIGLSLVISSFLYIPIKEDDNEPMVRFITILVGPVLRGAVFLAMGAIVHAIAF